MTVRPSVTYTPCVASLKGKHGDIITFAQFEEGNIWNKTCNDAESGDESDDDSIMPPLLIEEEKDAMDSWYESDHDIISIEMSETFVTEVSLIPTLIEENTVIKYVIALRKTIGKKRSIKSYAKYE